MQEEKKYLQGIHPSMHGSVATFLQGPVPGQIGCGVNKFISLNCFLLALFNNKRKKKRKSRDMD